MTSSKLAEVVGNGDSGTVGAVGSEARTSPVSGNIQDKVSEILTRRSEPVANETQRADDGQDAQGGNDRRDDTATGGVDQQDGDATGSVADDDASAEGGAAGSGGDGDVEKGITVADLAKHLEVEAADLYSLEIPVGDGVTVSLGEMKDQFKQYGPVVEAREKLKADTDNYEKALLATRAELNAIMEIVSPWQREQMLGRARAHQAQWEQEQERTLLEAVPEWKDEKKRNEDRQALIQYAAEYGFTEAEITHTQDARTLRMLRDFTQMKRDLASIRQSVKGERTKPGPAGKQSRSMGSRKLADAIKRAKASPYASDKAAAISQILNR